MMKNMKIAMKLGVSFLIITLLAVSLAAIGIFLGSATHEGFTHLLDNTIERERNLRDMQLQFTMMRYRAANYAMEYESPDIITGTLTPQYQAAYAAFTDSLNKYTESNKNDRKVAPGEKSENEANANNLKTLVEQFRQESEKVRSLALSGDGNGATTLLRDVIPLTGEINALLGDMIAPAAHLVESESENMEDMTNRLTWVLVGIVAACVVISVLLTVYISGLIGKPLKGLTAFMERAGQTGGIIMRPEEELVINRYKQYNDELGHCLRGTLGFIHHVVESARELDTIANGDLTLEIEVESGDDMLGISLKKMVDSLSHLLGEINSATHQVATGSKQVADGAQSLAQGSTQQAAAVEQLSASVSQIADKTRENAGMAEKAANLAQSIKESAVKGEQQMEDMIAAVKDINAASQSVSKVIKVIDDIAFQTNILALNAAVEAARAGQHGKGFAVVAEEVRNLASKSAEAAKETGDLIADSAEKAELGSRIAHETADSLEEIVQGISESAQIVAGMARSEEEQSSGILQINRGIDQVAQVIQENSATAEQSAAASEQMSGQAEMLEELIAQFTLKDGGRRAISAKAPRKILDMPEKTAYGPTESGDYGKY